MLQQIVPCNANYLRFPLDSFLADLPRMRRNRFAYYATTPHILLDHRNIEEAVCQADKLEKLSIQVDTLILNNYGYSLFAPYDGELYRASKTYYSNGIRAARALGAGIVCIRPQHGYLSSTKSDLFGSCEKMLKDICRVAEENDIRVAVGTGLDASAAYLNTIDELSDLLAVISSKKIGALLDFHAMGIVGENPIQWMKCFGERLFYVLVSDGRSGGYRRLRKGIHPVDEYLYALDSVGYEGGLTYFVPVNSATPMEDDSADFAALSGMLEKIL